MLFWLWIGMATAVAAAPNILIFGDSLSAAHGMAQSDGWVARLRPRLQQAYPNARLINASVSGETSAGGRARFDGALARSEADIVVLELGGNDGLQVLDPSTMQQNLAAMIETARDEGARVLLLGIRIPPNFGPAYTKRFHGMFDTLAERYEIAYDPFFLAPIADDRSNFQSDGIHPTAEVQPEIAQRVWTRLEPMIEAAARR